MLDRFLGGSLLRAHGGVGKWAVHHCWMSLFERECWWGSGVSKHVRPASQCSSPPSLLGRSWMGMNVKPEA